MRTTRNGIFTLLAIGGYFAWRNRERIRHLMDNRGANLGSSLRSAADRLTSTMDADRTQDTSSSTSSDSYMRKASGI